MSVMTMGSIKNYLINLHSSIIFNYCSLQDCDNDPTGEIVAKTQQTLTFYEVYRIIFILLFNEIIILLFDLE